MPIEIMCHGAGAGVPEPFLLSLDIDGGNFRALVTAITPLVAARLGAWCSCAGASTGGRAR